MANGALRILHGTNSHNDNADSLESKANKWEHSHRSNCLPERWWAITITLQRNEWKRTNKNLTSIRRHHYCEFGENIKISYCFPEYSLTWLPDCFLQQFLINMMMCKKALFRTHYHYFQEHPAQKKLVKAIFSALGFLLLAFLIIC